MIIIWVYCREHLRKRGLTREELDKFAATSQQKAVAAQESGAFDKEIVPVEVKKKKETIVFAKDEGPRPGTTAESIAKLRPAFKKDGIVTAANSSGINDGAAASLLERRKGKRAGVKPMATMVAGAFWLVLLLKSWVSGSCCCYQEGYGKNRHEDRRLRCDRSK